MKMDSPIRDATYSNKSNPLEFEFLSSITKFYRDRRCDYFGSLCYYCHTELKPLNRCGGCQLVSYCSRECQKKDRLTHKYICKKFPVVDEKSVMHTKGPWKEHIAGLLERAAELPHPYSEIAKFIFYNPRICNYCRDPFPVQLKGCICVCASFCSERCKAADKHHAKDCSALAIICRAHIMLLEDKPYPPNFKDMPIWRRFKPINGYDDVVVPPELPLEFQIENFGMIQLYNHLIYERLSYTMSLYYALQSLPGRHLSKCQPPLEDVTTLCIHVVINIPLFDSLPWETFLHRLPKLNKLKVVFILQGEIANPPLNYISGWIIERCLDCYQRNRVITYSIRVMWYHMYFSSDDYTEPDIVVIYGNTQKMLSSAVDTIHSEISYRNMTDSENTVLVLTDTTQELVKQGAQAVNAIRPVERLVAPQKNPMSGFSSYRGEMGSDLNIINEKSYFTCLKRQ